MLPKNRGRSGLYTRLDQSLSFLTTGGTWAIGLPERIRRNLTWFWYDGFFGAASENIVTAYLTLYLLALGATGSQIGLLSSLSSLAAALMLIPGAMLVERFGHRSQIWVANGGGGARLSLLLLALVPFFLHGQSLVVVAIGLSILRDTFNNLGYPAWLSLTADIVPFEGRGRYFAARNFATGLAGMISTLVVGLLISLFIKPAGYQFALGLAFILGTFSTYSFLHIRDPHPARPQPGVGAQALPGKMGWLGSLRGQPAFLALCGTTALWNLSLNVAGPFFNVHLVENLGASAAMVGFASIASSLTGVLAQTRLGELADRIGSRRLQSISGLLIPILPLLWFFVTAPWQVIGINLLSGALWAAYNLSSFNYLLAITPPGERPRYSAIYQVVVTLSLSAGAALGSLMVTWWGYPGLFLVSFAGRVIAALLFNRVTARAE